MRLTLAERLRAIRERPRERLEKIPLGRVNVEIGAGLGYFAIPAAARIGSDGMVYAVEPVPARAAKIRERAADERLGNVTVLEARAEDLGAIPDGAADCVYAMYSLHHVADRERGFREIIRVMKPGATFFVRDFVKGRIVRHGLTEAEVKAMFGYGFKTGELLGRRGRYIELRFTK